MKKLLLVTIFTLCLPLASYALTCPRATVLNKIIHSENFYPGSFKTAGFDVPWFVQQCFPYKSSTVTRFDRVIIPTAIPWSRAISCVYNYKSAKGASSWFVIDNYQGLESQFVGIAGKWYGQAKGNCKGNSASDCQFKRDAS